MPFVQETFPNKNKTLSSLVSFTSYKLYDRPTQRIARILVPSQVLNLGRTSR